MSRRVNLTVANETDAPSQLNFSSIGDLTNPISADWVNVVKISIPNANIPIFIFPTDYVYTFTLAYKTYSFSQNLVLEDRGNGANIYEISHLVSMMNTALAAAVVGLNAAVPLPTANTPYVSYNNSTSMYSLLADPSAYDKSLTYPISISCNSNLYYILQSIPSQKILSGSKFIFSQTAENTFWDNQENEWIKLDQESITLCNYATPRLIWITTSMPVQSEAFVSKTVSSNQSYFNVLQSLTINYNNGIIDFNTNNDFTTVQDRYRRSKVDARGIYSVKCDVYWLDNKGTVYPFFIPPHTSALIMLDFWSEGQPLN